MNRIKAFVMAVLACGLLAAGGVGAAAGGGAGDLAGGDRPGAGDPGGGIGDGGGGGVPIPDLEPPSTVDDLAATPEGTDTIRVEWTAPTDASGVSQYDLRYSLQPIDDATQDRGFDRCAVVPCRGNERRELHGLKPSWPIRLPSLPGSC